MFLGFRSYLCAAAASALVLSSLAPVGGLIHDRLAPPCDPAGCVLDSAGDGATLTPLPPEPSALAPTDALASGLSALTIPPVVDRSVTPTTTTAPPTAATIPPTTSNQSIVPSQSTVPAVEGGTAGGEIPGASTVIPGDGLTTAAGKRLWGNPKYVDNFDAGLGGWSLYDGPGHAGNGRRSPAAATTQNGVLTISGDANGTTEGMAWKFGSMYGRWEGRMRAPVSDPSYNALMLLWPDAENFPVGGEIDFVEMMDHTRQTTDLFLHYGASNKQVHGQVKIDATQWHNWAVEWTPKGVAAYVDGEPWWSTTDTSILPPGPMHMTLQLDWFPKNATGPVKPSQMFVDWVAFYPVDGSGPSAPIPNVPGGPTGSGGSTSTGPTSGNTPTVTETVTATVTATTTVTETPTPTRPPEVARLTTTATPPQTTRTSAPTSSTTTTSAPPTTGTGDAGN